jgi:ATP/maltotriose-dependent transcriptional regulator MalT
VAGRRVDAALLAEASSVRGRTFDRGLQAAVERGVLLREADPSGEQVAFRHALIQEVIFDSVLPGERIRLHRRIAEALARRLARSRTNGPGRWAELAMHWDAGRDEPRAFDAALHAAAEAVDAYAFGAALAQYRRALAGWEVVTEPASVAGFDHIELLSRAAEAAWLSGQDQVALLREAIAEADASADARGAMLRGRLGYALWVTGDPIEARSVYQEAVARFPPGPATPERAWVLARLAQALMLEGGYRESMRLAESALQLAREAGGFQIEAHALNTLAAVEAELGMGSRAVETIERALALAVKLGVPDEVGRAYLNATEILATCGLDHRALELVWQGVDQTAAIGLQVAYSDLIGVHGAAIAFELGRWEEAAKLAAPMVGIELDPNTGVYVLARTAALPVATGRWEAAHAMLSRARELLERFAVEAQYTGPCAGAEAELALWEGRPDVARAAIEWGLGRLARTDDIRHRVRLCRLGVRATADRAGIARDHRDAAAEKAAVDAGTRLRDLLEAATATTAMDGGLAALVAAEQATAVAEEARLRGRCDPQLWREAAARWLSRERPYERAYVGWREAEAHLLAGDRAPAGEPLRTALEIAQRLGAEPLRKEIVSLARRARLSVEAAPAAVASEPGPGDRKRLLAEEFGLTRREVDVLELVAEGMTNRQIAESLFISVYTAGVHVSRILAKLDVTSRTEAASKAYRLGMVPA